MKTKYGVILLALLVSVLSPSSYADKLCLKVKFNKKTSKVSTKSTTAASCPKGFKELADTASFMGSAGADGSALVYGDGSDGALTVSMNSEIAQGNKQYTDVTIDAGVLLTVYSGALIRCTGTFTNNGTILILGGASGGRYYFTDASNYPTVIIPGAGISASQAAIGEYGVGNTYGGYGGIGAANHFIPSFLGPQRLGGGGGAGALNVVNGGAGGGYFAVYAQGSITNSATGLVVGDAGYGFDGSGGGGGGIVLLASKTSVVNSGVIYAQGGNGGNSTIYSGVGGGGGGGLIGFLAPSIAAGTTGVGGGLAGAATNTVTELTRSGGGGGGGSYGDGGSGGNADATIPAVPGSAGLVFSESKDPTSSLL